MYQSDIFYITVYLSFFVCSLVFSLLINGLFLKFSKTLGIRNDKETVIRWSAESKPAFGGISFYIIFLLSVTAYSFFFEKSQYFQNQQFLGILFAVTLGFLMGLFDDAYNTKPLLKLFAQITCGIILIATGTVINFFESQILNYILTLFWVVGIMNSLNMLDNMDAIASSITLTILSTIVSVIFMVHTISNPNIFILIGVVAGIIGFLYFNWHPSKMYMGDTGSQFLGVFVAAVGITYLWNGKDYFGEEIQTKQILTTTLVFLLPLVDTTTVFIKRIRKKCSPFIGGKDHTTHHLSYLGYSDRKVALIFFSIAIFSSILAIVVLLIPNWSHWYTLPFALYIIIVFAVLFYIANLNKK